MRAFAGLLFGLVAVALVLSGSASGQEKKVDLKKVPKAVLKAVKDKFPKAKIISASTEKENDKTVYEIQIKNEGKSADVTVTPEGKITTVETTIPYKELPKVVAEAFEKKYPRATVKRTEEVGDGDKVTHYELLIVTSDKKTLEVEFDTKGKFIKEEKKSGKDDD